jgi:hypothetical protein
MFNYAHLPDAPLLLVPDTKLRQAKHFPIQLSRAEAKIHFLKEELETFIQSALCFPNTTTVEGSKEG